MKLKFLFIALMICFVGIAKVEAKRTPDYSAFVTDDLHANVDFYEIMEGMGVFISPITQVQIAEFERLFQPALELIRNVDITGLTKKQTYDAYNLYLYNHPDLSLQLSMGIDGAGVPYLYRLVDDYVKLGNGAIFNVSNVDWYFSGYTIK